MWISLHILGVQSFAQSRLCDKDWFPWDRSTELLQEEEATGARLLGCSEIHGRLSFPTRTDWCAMSPGKAQLLQSSLKCFFHSIGLSEQRCHSQKSFGAALQEGDDHIFLPTSCTFGCDSCCPGRCSRSKSWPSRAKGINGGGSLKPTYPLSLGIRPGLERAGARRRLKDDELETVPQAEAMLDISLRETACKHEPAIYRHKREDKYKKRRCDQQRGRYITPETAAAVDGFGAGLFFSLWKTHCFSYLMWHLPPALSSITCCLKLFCLSIRCRLRQEGLTYQSQALQHQSPFLLLSLDEMYDTQQNHLGLQKETLLTDQYQWKDKLANTARRFGAAQEDLYLPRQDKSRENVIISSKFQPRASKIQEAQPD